MSEIKRKLTAEDFAFVQVDDKIYDQKFEGKPIGFFKDAWLRFAVAALTVWLWAYNGTVLVEYLLTM